MPGSTRSFSLARITASFPSLAFSISFSIFCSERSRRFLKEISRCLSLAGGAYPIHIVKNLDDILSDIGVTGKVRQVGIDLGIHRVVVPGTDVRILSA